MKRIDIKENIGLLIVLAVSFLAIVFAYINLPKNISSEQLTSLLNTLAQIQASIFAIIISLTLIAVQLASQKYSMRISSMFLKSWQFWVFFIIYFISLLFDTGIKVFFPNLLSRWVLFIGFSLFCFSFIIVAIYTKTILMILPPERLSKSLLKSLTSETVAQYIHAPNPSKDPLFPIKEILNALAKERDYKGVEMVIGELFGRVQEECTDVRFVSRFLESKESYTPIQDIYTGVSAYVTYFLSIPLEILENAYKFGDIKLFEIGLAAFRRFVFLLFGTIDKGIEHLSEQNYHAHDNISETGLRIALDHLILDVLDNIKSQFNKLLKLHEQGSYEEHVIISIYNDQILPLYGILGLGSSRFMALSASIEVRNAILNSTTRILKISHNKELQENMLYNAVSVVHYIIQKTLEQLIKMSSENTAYNDIYGIREIFGDQVDTLKQLTTLSISHNFESPALLGGKIIDANFEQLHRLVEAGITFSIKDLIEALVDILTNMDVDFEKRKLKPDAAVYFTKHVILSINDVIEEFSATCNAELLKFCLREVIRIYKIAYERYKFCWPYHERSVLTSNSLVISLENLLINNCHNSSLIQMTTDILTSLVVNLLQSSTQIPWEKDYIDSAKHMVEHLIYLAYVLVKYEKTQYAENLSASLIKINKKAEELGFPNFIRNIFREIKEKKEVGIHKKKQGPIPVSEIWVKLSGNNLKILEKFEKMYLDVGSRT